MQEPSPCFLKNKGTIPLHEMIFMFFTSYFFRENEWMTGITCLSLSAMIIHFIKRVM